MLLVTGNCWECNVKPCELYVNVAQSLRGIVDLLAREDGQDMMEYGLLAALIAPMVIVVILLIGPQLNLYFRNVVNAIP